MLSKLILPACGLCLLASASLGQVHNYSEAFQKSLFFYEIQHSGPVPIDHRVEWRGPSATRDGSDVGRDLTGGWYDAGDGVIWTIDDTFGATLLTWSITKYRDVYIQTGQYQIAMDRVSEISDYLTRIVQLDKSGEIERIYCGKGALKDSPTDDPAITNDRTTAGSNELLDTQIGGVTQSLRPAYWVDSTTGGADVAGAVSYALASASIAFREYGNATRAGELLALSKKVFAWGDANRNATTGTRRMTNGKPVTIANYPHRTNLYMPPMIYAAAWLHRADLSAATPGYTDAWVSHAEALYNDPANNRR
ncbi:MAG TPA: glycoside hydrolase family 9 protein, partial [Chthoniobacteraceae bacterium]